MDSPAASRSVWPAGHRAALCLTFDVDGPYGEANYRALDDQYWRSQTAYEPTGTARILDLLADADIPATFCWVGRAAEDHPALVQRAVAEGHEIALHTWDHRYYNRMTADEQRADLRRTFDVLHAISGTAPTGHKTAGWRYDDQTWRLVQDLGLTWVMDEPVGDLPTVIRPDPAGPPLIQLPPSAWFDDYTYFVDRILPPQQVFETWREDLDVLRAEGGVMGLTLHPFVSGRPGPSRAIVRLIDHAVDAGDIWIANADQIARWWLERERAAIDR